MQIHTLYMQQVQALGYFSEFGSQYPAENWEYNFVLDLAGSNIKFWDNLPARLAPVAPTALSTPMQKFRKFQVNNFSFACSHSKLSNNIPYRAKFSWGETIFWAKFLSPIEKLTTFARRKISKMVCYTQTCMAHLNASF